MTRALKVAFWGSAAALVYVQVGYPLVLAGLDRARRARTRGADSPAGAAPARDDDLPSVTLVVPAYREEDVIAAKVANALALDYPRERLEVVVACDGSPDRTAERAREAGADLVLELPRAGKIPAQDAAVQRARGEIVAFSDANALWDRGALRALVAPFADPRTGYACGQVCFTAPDGGDNQEGLYWRYEMAIRALESRLAGVTSGNGAIYAVRRDAYLVVDPVMGHDLAFPFRMVKRGLRAVYVPDAVARERLAPTIGSEFGRKRRMAARAWRITVTGGMLDPRGYDPVYALMILSHRLGRYLMPFLHVAVLATSLALARRGPVYAAALAAHLALLAGAALAGVAPLRALRVARYYVATVSSLAVGLWDAARQAAPAVWEPAEGTR